MCKKLRLYTSYIWHGNLLHYTPWYGLKANTPNKECKYNSIVENIMFIRTTLLSFDYGLIGNIMPTAE